LSATTTPPCSPDNDTDPPVDALPDDAAAVCGESDEPREAIADSESIECAPPPALTVGQTLQAGRVAAGLTVAAVAQSLKFSTRQIEALEADNYAALPGNTIVRGFVRSYARLLRIDPEDLLESLNPYSPNMPADVRPPDNIGVASEEGGLRQLSSVASAAIVISLATLLLGLWHFFAPTVTRLANDTPGSQKSSSAPAPQAAPPQPADPAAVPPADPPAAPTAPGYDVPAVPAAPPPPVATAAPTPVVAPAQAAPSEPSLMFTFVDRSWLEVIDKSKQVLHSGENPAGSQLTLSGRPPFDIVIGNAGKVKLTYGERVIDLAPYTRAEVARLKLE
jgi:cytoskeleton protein RodZ